MGDRANVVIQNGEDPDLYLYTHWNGDHLPSVLQRALRRGESRWDEDHYLARIIFCSMVEGDMDGLTGFGIGTCRGDYNHPDLVVNTRDQAVTVRQIENSRVLFETSIEGYCALDEVSWDLLLQGKTGD